MGGTVYLGGTRAAAAADGEDDVVERSYSQAALSSNDSMTW